MCHIKYGSFIKYIDKSLKGLGFLIFCLPVFLLLFVTISIDYTNANQARALLVNEDILANDIDITSFNSNEVHLGEGNTPNSCRIETNLSLNRTKSTESESFKCLAIRHNIATLVKAYRYSTTLKQLCQELESDKPVYFHQLLI